MTSSPDLPELFWHYYIKSVRADGREQTLSEINLTLSHLRSVIVGPWHRGGPILAAGQVLSSTDRISEIRISHTPDDATNLISSYHKILEHEPFREVIGGGKLLPVFLGADMTNTVLSPTTMVAGLDVGDIVRICERFRESAALLRKRCRADLTPYEINREYDVQDLLHSILRGYYPNTIQEQTLEKLAGRGSRADLAMPDLGILIEIKLARDGDDARLVNEFSQDHVLYGMWSPLRYLIYFVYDSHKLRDREQLNQLSQMYSQGNKRFEVRVVLV